MKTVLVWLLVVSGNAHYAVIVQPHMFPSNMDCVKFAEQTLTFDKDRVRWSCGQAMVLVPDSPTIPPINVQAVPKK